MAGVGAGETVCVVEQRKANVRHVKAMINDKAQQSDSEFTALNRATRILRDTPIPSVLPEDVVQRTLASIAKQQRRSFQFRAIAASVIIGLLVAGAGLLLFHNGSGQIALAEVAQNAMRSRSVAFVERSAFDDTFARIVMTDQSFMRLEKFASKTQTSPSETVIWNGETGEVLTLDHEKKRAIKMRQRPIGFDIYAWFNSIAAAKGKRIGEKRVGDREVVGYEVTHVAPGSDGSTMMQSLVWIDEETRLPVRIEYEFAGKHAMIDEIRFDLDPSELAAERFSQTIPKNYAVSDMGGIAAGDLRPPPTTREAERLLTIKPLVGIGPLKFGDSRERIIEIFGPPEDGGDERDMRYPSKGIALLFEPGVGLLHVVAHTRKMAGPFAINDFAGTTDRGIGMGATRARIEAVYGKPDEVQQAGVQVVLRYANLYMWLTLYDGKLANITTTMPRETIRAPRDRISSSQPTTRFSDR